MRTWLSLVIVGLSTPPVFAVDLNRRGFLAGVGGSGVSALTTTAQTQAAPAMPEGLSPISIALRKRDLVSFYSKFLYSMLSQAQSRRPNFAQTGLDVDYLEHLLSTHPNEVDQTFLRGWPEFLKHWDKLDKDRRGGNLSASASLTSLEEKIAFFKHIHGHQLGPHLFKDLFSRLEADLALEFGIDLEQLKRSIELLEISQVFQFLREDIDPAESAFYKSPSFSVQFREAFLKKVEKFAPRFVKAIELDVKDFFKSDPHRIIEILLYNVKTADSLSVAENLKRVNYLGGYGSMGAPEGLFSSSPFQFEMGYRSHSSAPNANSISLENHARQYAEALNLLDRALRNLSLLSESPINQKLENILSTTIQQMAFELKTLPQRRHADDQLRKARADWLDKGSPVVPI
jgi:hypothetical protein